MKKIVLTLSLLTMIVLVSQGQTRLGAGLGWGSDVEDLGIGVNGEFFVKDNISINPGIILFFADNRGYDDFNWWEFNINGNFYFATEGSVDFYGIAGLNLTTVSREDRDRNIDDSDTELGINLGIGANFNVGGSVLPYAEMKYILSDYDQLGLFFGVKFDLD